MSRWLGSFLLLACVSPAFAQDIKVPTDKRLGDPVTLNSYFPFTPPASLESWDKRRQVLREQILVANGLWPMPEKTPLKPTIHGKIERDGYTIEKVFFASYPGYYVCGNLYRPTGKTGKLPAILSPHGHWGPRGKDLPNGRMYEASDKSVEKEIQGGGEKTEAGARYPLQARCAQLARMGCIVFHYDMVGYADSQQIAHSSGFVDVEAELRSQSFMGLQTWNSVRALDFLLGLPDVDAKRVGVTGASGGGTQTFLLCAIDDRPAAAFPAVMVSTGMQGGCICENCSLLRINTGNVEIAGLWAPRPLGMTAANDWTKELETKGFPELKALYKLYGKENNVSLKAHLEFGHNYNQISREVMYNFFNKHLDLGQKEPVKEKPFVPVPIKELSVFDDAHPLPNDAVDAKGLRDTMTAQSDSALKKLAAEPEKYRQVLRSALRAMVTDELPKGTQVEEIWKSDPFEKDGIIMRQFILSRKGQGEAVTAFGLTQKDFDGRVVIWVHPQGIDSIWKDGKLIPEAQAIVDSKALLFPVEVFRTSKPPAKKLPVNANFAGFTFAYNRPLLAQRVHDILTAIGYAQGNRSTKSIHLIGFESAGPWTILAGGLSSNAVKSIAADGNLFDFNQVKSADDEMMLPGALKFGGMPAFVSLCSPAQVLIHHTEKTPQKNAEEVVRWVLSK